MSPDVAEVPAVSSGGCAQLGLDSAMRSPEEGGAAGLRQPHLPVCLPGTWAYVYVTGEALSVGSLPHP